MCHNIFMKNKKNNNNEWKSMYYIIIITFRATPHKTI